MNNPWHKIDFLQSSIPLRNIAMAIVNVVLLFLMGTVLDILVFSGAAIDSRLRLLMLALLVWQAQQSRATLLFFAMLVSLAIREPTGFLNRSWVGSGCYCAIALATLSWISRYRTIRNSIAVSTVGFLTEYIAADSSKTDAFDAKSTHLKQHPLDYLRTVGSKFVPILVSMFLVMLAAFLINFQPVFVNESPWLDWANASHQVLWPGPSLIVLVIGIGIGLNELFWRRKTASQFRLLVRSVMVQSHYPDFLRIARLMSKRKSSLNPSDRSQTDR